MTLGTGGNGGRSDEGRHQVGFGRVELHSQRSFNSEGNVNHVAGPTVRQGTLKERHVDGGCIKVSAASFDAAAHPGPALAEEMMVEGAAELMSEQMKASASMQIAFEPLA